MILTPFNFFLIVPAAGLNFAEPRPANFTFADGRFLGTAIDTSLCWLVHVQNIEMNSSSCETLQLLNLNGKNISESNYRSHIFTNAVHRHIHFLQEVMDGNVLSELQSQKTYSHLLKDQVGLQAITLGLRRNHDRIGRI